MYISCQIIKIVIYLKCEIKDLDNSILQITTLYLRFVEHFFISVFQIKDVCFTELVTKQVLELKKNP